MGADRLIAEIARLASVLDGNQWAILAVLATIIIVTAIKTLPDIIRAVGDLIRARSATPKRTRPSSPKPPTKPKRETRRRLWLVSSRSAEEDEDRPD